jgi:hypothetical protein
MVDDCYFCSGGINCGHWLIVDRKAFWNCLVGLRSKVLNLSDMNCVILLLYSCKYITTKVMPLSAFMIGNVGYVALVLHSSCCGCVHKCVSVVVLLMVLHSCI